jgi:hypothetical protein
MSQPEEPLVLGVSLDVIVLGFPHLRAAHAAQEPLWKANV